MGKKTYQLLVSRSIGIFYEVKADSKDEAIALFNDGEDCGDGYDEYDVESFVVEADVLEECEYDVEATGKEMTDE